MCRFEMELKRANLLPRVYWRFVDDVFVIIKKEVLASTISTLNGTKYKTIKFTPQVEENGQISFLDLTLKRKQNGEISFNVYRKPTNTMRFITKDSYCPPQHKMAAFHSMIYRLCKLPLSVSDFMSELKYIKTVANVNGYSESEIDTLVQKHSNKMRNMNLSTFFDGVSNREVKKRVCFNYAAPLTNRLKDIYKRKKTDVVFASENKLKNFLASTKDKIEKCDKSGIYEIKCEICNKVYTGQTRRKVIKRYKEHCAHVKYNRPEKSAVAKHILKDFHAAQKDLTVKLKKQVNKPYKLDAWESLFMHKNKNSMNTDPAPIISPLFNF